MVPVSPFILSKQFNNRYNAAAWREPEFNRTLLVLREVDRAGHRDEPDSGTLVLMEIDDQGIVHHEEVVWQPDALGEELEDARALVLPDSRILIGFTALRREGSNYVPYPAFTILDRARWRAKLPAVQVITERGPGKNFTPIDASTFFFRPEHQESYHRLEVVSWENGHAECRGTLHFPIDIPWASWRIGTTLSPLWVNETEALLIFHGIQIVNQKYVYSLGRAKLKKVAPHQYTLEIDPIPLLTPDHFRTTSGEPLVSELHPELRRVVYACGGVMKTINNRETLALYVNVGDRQTIEVPFALDDLKKDWW